MAEQYEAIIGLEVHVQLSTESKLFATSSTEAGKKPNTLTDPTTLGLPGCLPVLNRRVVDYAIRLGLATNCEIARTSIFARKHYMYPDLPKGYQISQYEQPICQHGVVELRAGDDIRSIKLNRIHLEEDAGKNVHLEQESSSIVDLNRAGVPLVEIVSEPEIRSPEEASAYMRQIRQIVRYLDISDGNMEEGSLRCDANISLRKRGASEFGEKVEIKNLNSFRHVEKALEYEISRQTAALEHKEAIVQETRLWDEAKGETRSMRSKEYAADYRYFPDPDLLPLEIDSGWINSIKAQMPELPNDVFVRFKSVYGLDDRDCEILTEEKLTAKYFDQAVSFHSNPKGIANWITTELYSRLNRDDVDIARCPVSPESLATMVRLIDEEVISGKIAKTVFEEMFETSNAPEAIIQARGLQQVSDRGTIEDLVDEILEANPDQVAAYRAGKEKVFGFFVGQIMKASQGKVNPRTTNEVLKEKLKPEEEGS